MKNLLTVTAVIETGTGLALIAFPSVLARILLGSALNAPVALTIARIAGVAIFALAVGCWLSRNDSQSGAARSLVTALLIYNLGVSVILVYAGLGSGLSCLGLWTVVIAHTFLCAWCVVKLLQANRAVLP
jgi:hypothetical protein